MAQVRVDDHTAEVLAALKEKMPLALAAIGQEAEGYAKDECPVDTGRLRNSIANKVVKDENAVYIGTNVEYGVYVEYGDASHRTGKKHFLRDAAANHGDHYREIAEAVLKS
jgi:phage gpG-like protein